VNLLNLTYYRVDLVRHLRDLGNTFFIIGLPVLMYLVVGSTFASGDEPVRAGNMQFYAMTSMAMYGAATATTAIAGMAALERIQGWGRQLGLTPMRPAVYVVTKVFVALTVAAAAVVAVFVAGLLTGARAESVGVWLGSAVLAWLGSALFAVFGLAVAQLFKSEGAVSVASGALVLLAFLGNLFIPLSGTLLQIARFTPMYGYAGLVRWPQLQGLIIENNAPALSSDPLWVLVLNYVLWALVFATLAIWAVRRGRRRQ